MRPPRSKTLYALTVLGAICVLVLLAWRAAIEWGLIFGGAALLVAVGVVLWSLAKRVGNGKRDRVVERPSELSTLAFPPSAFRNK